MTVPLDVFYLLIAVAAFVVGLVLVPVAQRLGAQFGFVDHVDAAKIHDESKVRCGGAGIYVAFVLTLGAGVLISGALASSPLVPAALHDYIRNIRFVSPKLIALVSGGTLLFIAGLADDKKNLRPGVKLALQIVSALPLIAAGVTVRVFIDNPIVNAAMTIGWVVLLTNAFNFMDNMDGLASGVAAVVTLNFYLLSRAGSEYFMMAIFAVLLGSILGFWRYNFPFPRARLFMGDSGSLFIGYMLAGLSTMVTYYRAGVPTELPVVAPLIVLGVPIFDAASVLFIRWRAGKPLMKGDQNHFSHRLVALGLSRRDAVLFIYLITFAVGLTAVNLRWLNWAGASLALLQVALFFIIIFLLERAGQNASKKK